MSELLFKPFADYIKLLATQHKKLLHVDGVNTAFIRMQSEEDIQSIPQQGGKTLVAIESIVGRAVGDFEENRIRQTVTLFFLQVTQPGNSGDQYEEIETALNETYLIMLDFLARIKEDYIDDDCSPLQGIIPQLVLFTPIDGPVLEAHYGWRLDLPFDITAPVYDASQWNLPV